MARNMAWRRNESVKQSAAAGSKAAAKRRKMKQCNKLISEKKKINSENNGWQWRLNINEKHHRRKM